MDIRRTRPESRTWTRFASIWAASIWFGFGLFAALQTVFVMRSEGMHHAWARLFLTTLLSWLPWALATMPVIRLARRYPLLQLKRPLAWLAHVGACLSIGLVFSVWTAWLEVLLNPYADSHPTPFHPLWLYKFTNGILSTVVIYATLLIISYGLQSRERLAREQTETARLNEQLSKAQLDALRKQIEPHFLFNTLNSVAGLVRQSRNDDAITMIAGLSDFLRRMLDDSTGQQVVPLRQEMEFTEKYLDIQKVRFAERLRVSVDIAPELYTAQVPSLLLQPMVENAIKHGIAKQAKGGAICVSAWRSNGTLTLSVSNDGPGLPAESESMRPGIGISNVRTRLKSLYGDAFQLTMKNRDAGGVQVTVSLPFAVCPQPLEA